jgi:hypothetical protein
MSQSLVDRYDDRIAGILSCYDRVVITGTLPGICYADGMTRYLNANGIRIFDYPQFAMKLRDRVRECAASLAVETGVTIEHFGKRHIRKEAVVAGGRTSSGAPGRSPRPGAHHLGHGSLQCLSTLARQADAQDIHPAGQRQMPTPLFLLHGCPVRFPDGPEGRRAAPDLRWRMTAFGIGRAVPR